MSEPTEPRKLLWYEIVLLVLVFILLIPIALIFTLISLASWLKAKYIQRPRLLRRVKNEWLPKNKFILFVYSDNELWKEYAEKNIIPKISQNAVILNWSIRNDWINSNTLEALLFKNFQWGRERIWRQNIRMGGQDYNHMAIVFNPWDKPKIISFWEAFKDYEFGKKESMKVMEGELYSYL